MAQNNIWIRQNVHERLFSFDLYKLIVRISQIFHNKKFIFMIKIDELTQHNITATRAVSVRFTTYYYPDRPVHSRANFNPPGCIQESCYKRCNLGNQQFFRCLYVPYPF